VSDLREILDRCTNILPGYRPRRPLKEVFAELAAAIDGDEFADAYGSGAGLFQFEREIAEQFGKEAAVFMPSGTMAQQIALRIWCEKRGNLTLAMHPTAHLEWAEQMAYQVLHGMQRIQFGAPEFLRDRMLTRDDFERLGQEPGAILLELPYRPLGGSLPTWDELQAIQAWATERGVRMHLDGARIWQCRPFYGKEYREIADLFDSVYVSFYKDVGGLSGAMLMGSTAFIDEARVWQIRHGGRLVTQGPSWVSAKLGLQRVLPQIDQWVEKAREVAAVLSACEGVWAYPDPPHTNLFHLYIRGDAERLNERHLELAKETGTFLFFGLGPSAVPGVAMTEIHCLENTMRFDVENLRPFLERLLS